jgi:hypothetical protein
MTTPPPGEAGPPSDPPSDPPLPWEAHRHLGLGAVAVRHVGFFDPTVDAEAQNRLTALLPAGYSEDACTPVEPPKGAVAMVNCTKNTNAGGPPSATYALMKDEAALSAAVDAALADADVVDCPGNIQSPGPWRRNATPQKVAGTLVCGMPHGQPQVVWTNDAQLVLNLVRAGPEGPTLDQMYAWWSDHS